MGHESPYFPSSFTCLCRICHEEEEEGSTGMESPCACAGTLKFAHRDCVQRWCDEKGSNVCEICLQTFEPGYTFSEKKALADVVVTIRLNHDPEILSYNEEDNGETGHNYEECSTSSQRGATFCRSVAIMLTVMLLVRHFFAVMMLSSGQYAFGILTFDQVFVLRACGIVIPFYVVMRLIAMVQKAQLQHHLEQHQRRARMAIDEREEQVRFQHPIQIGS
ncbi:uncharacterized protein LOC122017838 isoform X1 [Zingiber officinale]|uniref:uncharacterized protein LOC122008576 isoform X1 n=1 Tax=Zingiber officinale TaxID=94328 RepID=UPI001C4C5D90|nr:uncharacterized protein LOC122008576 isoform X1 [Zingiber officinale]XP_042431478.1 uncharacterized protein LOC122017838 isoform X1 [Zingiber officinale]